MDCCRIEIECEHYRGIIDVETRGQISVRLPRFKEFVEKQFSSI